MTAGRLLLTVEQGSLFERRITWMDSNDDPLDMSGWTARMQIRDSYGGTVILDTDVTGDIFVNESPGELRIRVESADTADLEPGSYVYDLLAIDTDSEPHRLLEGQVEITPQVTL